MAKRKLALAREKHKNVDDELRATFQTLTEVSRLPIFSIKKKTYSLFQSGEIATRSAEEYGDLIENLRAQLELNLVTNAGVIEQYERRQKEVCDMSLFVLADYLNSKFRLKRLAKKIGRAHV